MAEIRKSVLIEHSAQEMYALVDGIEDYPSFLPWCGGTEVAERTASSLKARIHISYHGIKAFFATSNENESGRSIRMRLNDGPFRKLDGEWRFTPLGDHACKIDFMLAYEFSNGLLDKVLGPVFNHIANSFVEAFIQRADQLSAQLSRQAGK
jgi:ribosome-associated toxin RatA of RatAB toxin-antitoxin module